MAQLAEAAGEWRPFRPGSEDLAGIAAEVAAIPTLQAELVGNHPQLTLPDRVAHQFQIAGGKVRLQIAEQLPPELVNVGVFSPGDSHHGVGRISTGLGCPHRETDPDFLGLMAAFRPNGKRVDFVAINDPTAPTDTHRSFVDLLAATAAAAGAEAPFGIESASLDLVVMQTRFVSALIGRMGPASGAATAAHVLQQTKTTWHSSTAYQTYWTGIVEAGGTAGKFMFKPLHSENTSRAADAGDRHLSEEWRRRHLRGPIAFRVFWLGFVNQRDTPTERITKAWQVDRPWPVGELTFSQVELDGDKERLWSALASEMGANPGHWRHDVADTIAEPATVFEVARKIAYAESQRGRNTLPEELYADVFANGEIGAALAEELRRRRAAKAGAGHVDGAWAPSAEMTMCKKP